MKRRPAPERVRRRRKDRFHSIRVEDGKAPETVPMINLSNLKHAIIPLRYAHVGGDASKRFLHVTLAAGNDTPGRTAEVRLRASQVLGGAKDRLRITSVLLLAREALRR